MSTVTASRAALRYYHGIERLRYVGSWSVAVLATVLYGSVGIIVSFLDGSGHLTQACARAWGRALLWICGIRLVVTGGARLKPTTACVFVANHQSGLDIPALLVALPTRFHMLAKASLFRIPFLGWYMTRVGYVPVQRSVPRRAARSLDVAVDRLDHGASILVFAEGTRTPEGELRRFKSGSFRLARARELPIVPIALINSGRLLPSGERWPDPGVIEVRIGEPVPTTSGSEPHELARLVHERIRSLMRSGD